MKTLKITPPDGHEIDKKKSTFEEIVFKKIENEFPDSVKEITNRNYYIHSLAVIYNTQTLDAINPINHVSTKERAKAFLALMQLVELRDYVNEDWRADWKNLDIKYTAFFEEDKLVHHNFSYVHKVLHFKSAELRNKFSEKYSDLIEQAKELL